MEHQLKNDNNYYGFSMFEADTAHTSEDDLVQLFRWINTFNEGDAEVKKNAVVVLSCMPQYLGMVEKVMKQDFCNAGTAICAGTSPTSSRKNPAVGLVSDLEFMVSG